MGRVSRAWYGEQATLDQAHETTPLSTTLDKS